MATPIKETPILKGKDAKLFMDKMDKITMESICEANRIVKNYLKMLKLLSE